jgi:deoxyribodipyrimidine photo-lyase
VRAVHWFRNDLRLRDNTALAEAARSASELVLLFVLDPALLRGPAAGGPRVRFLLDCLARLAADAERAGSRLVLRAGDPVREVPRVLDETRARLLTWNRDTTPRARRRDAAVRAAAARRGVDVRDLVDRVVFESGAVQKRTGGGYAVYSPFARAWRARHAEAARPPQRAPRLPPPAAGVAGTALPSPAQLGFGGDRTRIPPGGSDAARRRLHAFLDGRLRRYDRDRDRPALDGTSRLSPYLRFGAISVRECFDAALAAGRAEPALRAGARKWTDELVWREFYAAVLEQHPRNLERAYRRELERVRWLDDADELAAWCEGRTGYPIVDAGMRQLAATGWMHNRVRMIAASFLTKDLLVDWRRGERFFFLRLVDGDPASNNGGWQWAASTGSDPLPYFRIFDPVAQGRRFDPEGAYVRRWIPELRGVPDAHVHAPWQAPGGKGDYPDPIVDHAERRRLALARYRAARAAAKGRGEDAGGGRGRRRRAAWPARPS